MSQPICEIMQQRYSRRGVLKTLGLGLAASSFALPFSAKANNRTSTLAFESVARGLDETHHLAHGYDAHVLLRWGDKLFSDATAFEPAHQSAAAQSTQFGFNNDFIAYFPLGGSSAHGLLCINHEYTAPESMFPGGRFAADLTDEEHRIEMAAHGCSVVEVRRGVDGWQPVYGTFNRRITATTPMRFSGAAAGDKRLQTKADPSGTNVIGMFGNCAGGQTPWNSYLTCEENIDGYFFMDGYVGKESANHAAMTIGRDMFHRWDQIDPRFNVNKEPNEPNRFGWVVELDPFDPQSTPVKRTSLGRFKHEGASPVINKDGRIVVYMGDDEHFEHIYKFVSQHRYNPDDPKANDALLDDGTLYAARFKADGTTEWLPLVFGTAPLNETNGFTSQADVLIETRRAAKLTGATPMDRPEDVEVNPTNGRIYASMTKNPKRIETDHINHHAPNPYGYVLEMIAPNDDHAATHGQWELFLHGSEDTLACPDNLAFDAQGRIWITTDGQPDAIGSADAVYGADTQGEGRALTKCLFRAPIGAEMTGPCFTPDNETFFVAVQHPGERSTFDNPSTRWPDFDPAMPPRSAVVAITKKNGGKIGS